MQRVSRASFLKIALYVDELIQLETDVLRCAAENRRARNFCANNMWYSFFKPRMRKLVGDSAEDDRLRTSKAYDTVYQYLYHLLPDCNHDGICWMTRSNRSQYNQHSIYSNL